MTTSESQFQENFFSDADRLLTDVEQLLLDMEIDNPNTEVLNEIIRAIKRVKIGSVVCGFMEITELTFILEYLLVKVIENKITLTSEHIDRFLKVKDVLIMQLDSYSMGTLVDPKRVENVQILLNEILSQVSAAYPNN